MRLPALTFACILTAAAAQQRAPLPPPSSGRELGACQACRLFVDSFKRALQHTARGNFAGGDAAWEEEKLGRYSRSEVRLAEIQERLCTDVESHSARCHAVAELAEPYVEQWWSEHSSDDDDIFPWLCIESLKSCCPDNHYGPDCLPCKGGAENPCSGNGKCKGNGTRKGNGECVCDAGYSGPICESCAANYYESYRDDGKFLCSRCHKSCRGQCKSGGVTGCIECAPGWVMDSEGACTDVNECIQKDACDKNEFCVNTEGSYKCLKCDKSCDGCTGDGPDMCRRCAAGFQMQDDLCVDSKSADMSRRVTVTRYLTYFGLCVTICIIFQKSTMLAGALGLAVALYISVSEYMLAGDTTGPNPVIDPSSIDFGKLFSAGS